jgi:hypothetical protein
MFDVLKAYKEDNEDKEFVFMHCFQNIQGVKKWDKVRLSDVEDGPLSPLGSFGRSPNWQQEGQRLKGMGCPHWLALIHHSEDGGIIIPRQQRER